MLEAASAVEVRPASSGAERTTTAGHDGRGMASSAPLKRAFRPEIQGLRAVAVLLVVLYHVWLGRVSGGVDVFLMISAFLMTGQFVARHRRGERTRLVAHWLHVFRRLLPAAAVTVAGTVVAAVLFLPATRWSDVLEQGWASLLYAENWLLQRDAVDYYAQNHALASPFQHFWSLSIQGQIFILFPLMFVALGAVSRRFRVRYERVLAVVLAFVFAASLAYSIADTAANQAQAYFSLPARVWEFALGSLLALVIDRVRVRPWAALVLGWAGVASIVACGLVLNVETAFPGAIALWPTLSAAAVILAAQRGGRFGVHRLLASRPLRGLGDISYGLYLWHWPVLVIALTWRDKDRAGWLLGSAAIVVSLVLAFVTIRFVDRPWRAWAWPEARVRNGIVAVAACALVAAVPIASVQATVLTKSHAAEAQAVVDNPGAEALAPGYTSQASPTAQLLPLPQNLHNDWFGLPSKCSADLKVPASLAGNCSMNTVASPSGSQQKTIVVVGDSHAEQWTAALEPVAEKNGWRVVDLLLGGCLYAPTVPTANAACNQFNANVAAYLAANPPSAVFMVGTVAAPSSAAETLTPGLDQTVSALTSKGVEVVAIRDNPRFTFDMAECVLRDGQSASQCRPGASSVLAETNPLTAFAAQHPDHFAALDMTDLICPDGVCSGVIGNTYVYIDDNHLTKTYAATMSSGLGERLSAETGWV
ncbi:acyltransferase family protein [Sinomonas sp. ASV322]|uniref:acyltransferase family protein n=1 Tax=Sinomonas sp. ASV322 TaxID=3041920 RepID=UPI0027DE1D9A|nr:acyltransferase family protein [Sinomonas sp. ASV322]MDQ4501944.1 acyltransferase family protein [Sinomonas sp. ASV322]